MPEYKHGKAVLRYEEELAKCRFFDLSDIEGANRPPYSAVCDISRWTADICEIRGFKGAVTRNHVRCLIRALVDRGYRVAYIERPDGQGLDAVAQLITGGDFDGWYRMDLPSLITRLRCNEGIENG